MKIVVLAGGLSTERDVSFKTGEMVTKALRENGHQVILLDVFMGYSDKEEDLTGIFDRAEAVSVKVAAIPETAPDLEKVKAQRKDQSDNFFGPNVIELCRMADIVFMALHGENGENGKIQAAFDLFGIRYTGTGYLGSALAMNKGMAKQLFLENGIPTPRGTSLKRGEDAAKIETCGIHFPCVVKPCSGGSSIGVSIVHDKAEYEQALKEAFRWENELVIEEYVKGREFSVGVIDFQALPIIEIAPVEEQIQSGKYGRDLPGGAVRADYEGNAGICREGGRGAWAQYILAHRLPSGCGRSHFLSGGEHTSGHDADQSAAAGGKGDRRGFQPAL